MKVLSVLLVLALCAPSRGQRPTVTLSDGSLEGITMETWQGNPVNAFLNVPFAAPPLGPLRFAPPQPAKPWKGTRDAGSPSPTCTQYQGPELGVMGQEDCLYLNVYTPQATMSDKNSSLPVLVFFHPGSYNVGASNAFGPRYLLDYDLILVIPNYRVGLLGFLTTGDALAPGNMGMKDQVAALQWIQKNIEAFGGNPNEVTITGVSAGSQSVTYHYLSPMSQGLFKRGIAGSGSCLQPSAQQKAPLYKTKTVAEALDCPTKSSDELIACLRSVPDRQLVAQQGMFQPFFYLPLAVFGPTVEPDLPGAFITQGPYQSLRTGQVFQGPTMFSSVTQEGLVPSVFFLANETALNYVNNNWLQVAPAILDYQYTVTSENINEVSLKVREYYLGNLPFSLATNQSIIQMLGDRTWLDDMEINVRLQSYAQSSPAFYYRFGYRGQYSIFNDATGSNLNFGVSHTDDVTYILNSTTYPRPENISEDREMIGVLTQIWANFAINGTASAGQNADWAPVNRTDAMNGPFNYLKISSPSSLVPEAAVTFGHSQFWNNLPINEPGSGRPSFYTE